jgi:hypothetical protein
MSRGPAGTPVMSGSLLMPRTMAVLWMCRRPCGAVGRSGRLVSRDLLIAAVARREHVTVLHYDSDYELIAQVTGQSMAWVVPRGDVP